MKPFDLLPWYDVNRRRLPWRQAYNGSYLTDPYRIWVSEIMLQQTQVATVIPYYKRFLKRFPDIRTLARAPESEVLRYWAGLGYYSRARNLRRAAQKVIETHGGRFPETREEARSLPGIGPYTAGAILSIAFGKPYPVLDGNVMRVLARFFAIRQSVKEARIQKRLWALAEDLLDPHRPGDWNQALMELGALVCIPQSPRCETCPISSSCIAYNKGIQETLPMTDTKRRPVSLHWECLRIEKTGKILLWKRSHSERFLPGHWGLPETRHLPASVKGRRLAVVRHSITHHNISVEVLQAPPPQDIPPQARWVHRSGLPHFLVSSLWHKMVRANT